MSENEAAIQRIKDLIIHLEIASRMAKLQVPDGDISLSVTTKNKTEGRVVVSWDFVGFFNDIKEVVGFDIKEELKKNA